MNCFKKHFYLFRNNQNIRIILIIFFELVFSFMVFANSNKYSSEFNEANKLFGNKEIQKSLDKYIDLYNNGYDNFEINYNIGCAYYKLNMIGKSRFYFERALFYKPLDPDLFHNLSIIYKKIYNNPLIAEQIVMNKRLIYFIPSKFVIFLLFLFLSASVILLILFYLMNNKRILLIFLSICSLFLLIFTFLFFIQYYEFNKRNFVVTADYANIYIAPNDKEFILTGLREGDSGKIIDDDDNYYKVKLDNEVSGWIKNNEIITSR
jgi:hypothetical protein